MLDFVEQENSYHGKSYYVTAFLLFSLPLGDFMVLLEWDKIKFSINGKYLFVRFIKLKISFAEMT